MFSCLQSEGSKIVMKINMRELAKIYKKQIIEARTGLELLFLNGKEILLHFSTENRLEFFYQILSTLYEKTYKKKAIPMLDGRKSLEKMTLVNNWENNLISTFDYLLYLNLLSSRSFNNSSQYPVFPWVLKKYTNPCDFNFEDVYRDLTLSVGMMGDIKRAKSFIEKFTQIDVTGMGHFNYATHYSSPAITLQFMMRTYPYFEGYLELFGGLDNPNRMFYSIPSSFDTVWEDPNDLRELIPEFFCFPNIFKNSLKRSFGIRECDKLEVNHVILPDSSNSDPHDFIIKQRKCLESEIVRENIDKWIDIIFGYQQRGEEAEKAFNVYPMITTDPGLVFNSLDLEPVQKQNYRIQAYQWGQSPQQLFIKPHPGTSKQAVKKLLCDESVDITIFTSEMSSEVMSQLLGRPKCDPKTTETVTKQSSHIVDMKIIDESINGFSFVAITSNYEVLEGDSLSI